MAYNNENELIFQSLRMGSLNADTLLPAIHFPRAARIVSAHLINGADKTGDLPANKLVLELKRGDTVVASLDTAEDGGLVADTGKALTLVAGQEAQPALSNLTLNFVKTEGLPEITKITCLAAAGLDEKSFLIYDDVGSVGVWIDENGGASIPAGANGADRALELALVGDEDEEGVATALAALLNGDSKFSAIVDPTDATSVLVTASTVGTKTDAADAAGGEATGFTFEVTQQGAAASGNQNLTDAVLSLGYFIP